VTVGSHALHLRPLVGADCAPLLRLTADLEAFFTTEEVAVAGELMTERLLRGAASGYEFLVAEHGGAPVAYSCYGPIPATRDRFDLYWIVVSANLRGRGLGRTLLRATEDDVRTRLGGRRLYAETSSRAAYAPTRAFYLAAGFRLAALLEDYYRPGDGKCIYVRDLDPEPDGGAQVSRGAV
jgi:ribosomal protein S18 acetylase RimI-like enzyme